MSSKINNNGLSSNFKFAINNSSLSEIDMLQISRLQNITDTNQRFLKMLADFYASELVSIIGWAKQIPGFSNLVLNDQMKLLQSTWIEILTFSLTWRNKSNMGMLYFSQDIFLDQTTASSCGLLEFYLQCIQVAEKMYHLGLTQEEYLILKTLILANSDVKLDEPEALYKFRDTILNWLSNSIAASHPGQALRATQLIFLILPSFRQIDEITRRFWSNVYCSHKILMDNFLIEILGI